MKLPQICSKHSLLLLFVSRFFPERSEGKSSFFWEKSTIGPTQKSLKNWLLFAKRRVSWSFAKTQFSQAKDALFAVGLKERIEKESNSFAKAAGLRLTRTWMLPSTFRLNFPMFGKSDGIERIAKAFSGMLRTQKNLPVRSKATVQMNWLKI